MNVKIYKPNETDENVYVKLVSNSPSGVKLVVVDSNGNLRDGGNLLNLTRDGVHLYDGVRVEPFGPKLRVRP